MANLTTSANVDTFLGSANKAAMRTNMDLGTAATEAATAFATAAQGSTADTAASNLATHVANTSNPHSTTKAQVGLTSVTDDAQTKAAVVPNTAPAAGQVLVGNAGGTAYAPVSASGDATLASTGALTLATVNSNVGSYGSSTAAPAVTVNAKGLVTAVSTNTITPAVGSITGLGTGVGTALAIAVGSAGAPVVNGGALGTPASGTLTNCTFPTLNQSTSGNAATASTLQTARALNGVSFNGSADITVPRTGVVREVWIGAGAMTPRTTNGAAPATVEMATNDNTFDFLDFDTATEEGACFAISLPQAWNAGTVKAKVYWTAASGSGGVAWGLRATSYADDDALDAAYGTEQVVTDTLITANDNHITAATAAITIGNTPAVDDLLLFEITREVGNAGDTLAVDARLIGVKLQYTESGTEPSAW
jgi:hypothetical protein